MDELFWVGQCPWIAAGELSPIMDRHVSTINRNLWPLYDDGLVDFIEIGRGGRAERRWCLTAAGVRRTYPVPAGHHDHNSLFAYDHDPLASHLEEEHVHPPLWVSKAGAGRLFRRIEGIQALYSVFPTVFQGEGKAWHEGEGTPFPVSWRWLRYGDLVDAVGTYRYGEIEYRIGFCWLCKHLSKKGLLAKWARRFSDRRLHRVSRAEILHDRWWYETGPDPNYDPTPQLAGYVFVGQDLFATYEACRAIPTWGYLQPHAFMWVDLEYGGRLQEEKAAPSMDNVADPVAINAVGRPELLCPDRRMEGEPERPRPELPDFITRTVPLSNVLGTRIFTLVDEWSGLTVEQIRSLCNESRMRVHNMLEALVDQGLLEVQEGMYYLGKEGETYAANLAGIHVNQVRKRVRNEIYLDHKPVAPHRKHTHGRNEMMMAMKAAGLSVYGGWRTLENLKDVTQIPPDAVLLANLKIYPVQDDPVLAGRVERPLAPVFLEFERSAIKPERVAEKLGPYVKAYREKDPVWVIVVCETEPAAGVFRSRLRFLMEDEGLSIPAMVTTLAEVKKGPLRGADTIWKVWGRPVGLW